jgi:phosphoribosylformylglycinamidine (FGAM) synthase-like enzyme
MAGQSADGRVTTTWSGAQNQVKEIIYPLGATIDVRAIALGDETMSVLEIWGAEYQENDCLLIKPEDRGLLEAVAARERCMLQARAPIPVHCLATKEV